MQKVLIFLSIVFVLFNCSEKKQVVQNEDNDNSLVYVPDDSTAKSKLDSVKAFFDGWKIELSKRSDTSGMVFVAASGNTFLRGDTNLIGIDNKSINFNSVRFSYDWYMDDHEVTQKEYYVYMGKKEKLPPSFAYWQNFDKPVGAVSISDAILYCNAKSKFFGLDTVYTYNKNTVDISNISADYTKNGFSLPTPAEWEYVAKEVIEKTANYTNIKYSNYGMGGGSPVDLGNIEPIAGFYNYFGNMSEYCWGRDIIYIENATYVDPEIYNFVINSNSKIVAMGGNLTDDKSRLNPSLREYLPLEYTGHLRYYGIRTVLRVGKLDGINKNLDVEKLYGYHVGAVSGIIVDSLGNGIENVAVMWNGKKIALTDGDGAFLTDSITNKLQYISFEKDSFNTILDTVFVLGDSLISIGPKIITKKVYKDSIAEKDSVNDSVAEAEFILKLDSIGLDFDSDSTFYKSVDSTVEVYLVDSLSKNMIYSSSDFAKKDSSFVLSQPFANKINSVIPVVGDTFIVACDTVGNTEFFIKEITDSSVTLGLFKILE